MNKTSKRVPVLSAILVLGFAATGTHVFAGPPGDPQILTIPLFFESNQFASARSVLRVNVELGTTWIVWNLTSGAGTISGIMSETGQGSWALPDGTLSAETDGSGAVVWTMAPAVGPTYSMVMVEGSVTQTAGDLLATVQSMPLSFSPATGQQYGSLGLDLGLIEEVPPDGHYEQVLLAEQLWAGSRCNSATAKAAGSFLLMLANGAKCMKSGGLACAGLGGSALLLFSNLTDQKNICNNYSN